MPEDTIQPVTPSAIDNAAANIITPDPAASTVTPSGGISLPAPSADPTAAPSEPADSSAPELPSSTNSFLSPAPSLPTDTTATDSTAAPSEPAEPIIPTSSFPTLNDTTPSPAPSDDLADIKQQALNQLSPLVGQLDQTPEEKFRTTMMLIQASDNKDLVKDAFEAAQKITDEKARAQALLDVINEINYFTQHEAGADSPTTS